MQSRVENVRDEAYNLFRENNLEGMRSFIQKNPHLLNTKYDGHSTLLHTACENDQAAMAELLLTLGANVNVLRDCSDRSSTPLLWNIDKIGLDTVKVLIHHKANLDLGGPLYGAYCAASKKNNDVVEELIKAGSRERGDKVFQYAVIDGNEKLVALFIDHYFSVNAKDNEDKSLLSWAAGNSGNEQHYRIAQKLLSFKADVNAKDVWGRTPLFGAVSSAFRSHPLINLATLYLDHGAKIDSRDNRGTTPLLYAAEHAELSMVKLLVERASQSAITLDHRDIDSENLLHYAAKNHHNDV
ncbi:MAG: ankyrin repeat domain-containing protein, partial [Legionellales bacterium]